MNTNLIKNNLFLYSFGLTKIPMLLYLTPVVQEATEKRAKLMIPLTFRSRNHLGSMYFGALCVGADIAGGLLAMREIARRKAPVSFVFKDLNARFLKRAEGDVVFVCDDGARVAELVSRAESTGERIEEKVTVTATVPKKTGDDPVAVFELTISLKKYGKGRK